jgi:hypothetical protein
MQQKDLYKTAQQAGTKGSNSREKVLLVFV